MSLIMAHRGWSSRAPENTLAAFQLAIAEGWINSIELDVQLSKDGVPVVIHDFHVRRTTNGSGNVNDLTLKELRQLDAGSWFHRSFAGEKIPTLEEVLMLCKGRKKLNIELKATEHLYPSLPFKVVQLLKGYQMENEVVITSFDYGKVKEVSELTDKLETGIIVDRHPARIDELITATGANIVSISFWLLTKRFVEKQLAAGRKLIAWTVNSTQEIAFVKLASKEIEICTNYPEKAAAF